MEEKVKLIMDYREEMNSINEKRLEALEKREYFDIKREHLAIGDLLIPSKQAVIEVKTLSDFWGSIKNQRIFEQCFNMQSNYKNCSVVIIGNFDKLFKSMKRFNKIEASKIINICLGAYVSIMEKYGVKTYWCGTDYQFAKIVQYIADKAGESPEPKELLRLKATDKDRWVAIIASMCEGLGKKKAKEIVKMFPSFYCLSAEMEVLGREGINSMLRDVDGIGPKLADRLCEFLYLDSKVTE